MNATQRRMIIGSALFALLWTAQSASAWYSPNLQRWVNRDPVNELGHQLLRQVSESVRPFEELNLFAFVGNKPVRLVDPFGESGSTTFPIPIRIIIPIIRVNPLGTVITVVVTGSIALCKALSDECEREWRDARQRCAEELAKPHPSRPLTGGYKDIENCARGLVSEACGGNPVIYSIPLS